MTKSIRKTLISLVTQFKNTQNVTPVDFIQLKKSALDELETQNFLSLMRHEEFLEKVAINLNTWRNVRKIDVTPMLVAIYFVIFLLDQDNFEEILEAPTSYMIDLLDYLRSEEEYSFLTITACSFFDNDYVVNKILYPLLNKAKVLKELSEYLKKCERNKHKKIPVTVPREFHFKNNLRKSPPPPPNTSQGSFHRISSRKVPKTNKRPDLRVQNALKKEHENNVRKAQMLLERALKMSSNLTNPKKMTDKQVTPPAVHKKPRKIPASLKKEVIIKGNLTTTLREASHFIKDQEDEINRIEDILRGGYNLQKMEELELEDKRKASQRAMEDIKKKHIQGLITFEEAILAKKKFLEENKTKTLELKAVKMRLAKELNEWRKDQQKKIKAQVDKCQKIKNDARESEKRSLEKKQMEARIQQYEIKELLRKAEQEKATELSRKMELIEEIKTLHEVTVRLNEAKMQFDPTESPNLGLLCEMSVAELNERLALAKLDMNRQLEEKKRRIAGKKVEHQQMVEGVKKFIERTRSMPKTVGLPIPQPWIEESDELVKLRRVLEEKRNLRLNAT